jgi:hypothetical protein
MLGEGIKSPNAFQPARLNFWPETTKMHLLLSDHSPNGIISSSSFPERQPDTLRDEHFTLCEQQH